MVIDGSGRRASHRAACETGETMRRFAFIAALAAAALCLSIGANSRAASAGGEIVLAQGGSAGGSIGKRGKSESGEEDAPPRSQPRAPRREPAPARGADFTGRWTWITTCTSGQTGPGQFTLQQAGGTVTGICSSRPFPCSSISGQAVGNSATLKVRWADILGGHNTTVLLSLTDGGRSFRGAEESASMGSCTYQGHRN
jgi:hypothetical protein